MFEKKFCVIYKLWKHFQKFHYDSDRCDNDDEDVLRIKEMM